jgi:hypothetical protein
MAAALNARPLVPSSLSDVVRRFSPQYAAAEAAQANGKMTMAEKLTLKRGVCVCVNVRVCACVRVRVNAFVCVGGAVLLFWRRMTSIDVKPLLFGRGGKT